MSTPNYMVYPGHGVAEVTGHETRQILGASHKFIALKIIDSGMKIIVPAHNADAVGLRPIISKFDARRIVKILETKSTSVPSNQSWNIRYREYIEMIKDGDPFKIAEVLVALRTLKDLKELSFGERKMLDNCKSLLARELFCALGEVQNVD